MDGGNRDRRREKGRCSVAGFIKRNHVKVAGFLLSFTETGVKFHGLLKQRNNCAMKTKASSCSETSIPNYQAIRRHIPRPSMRQPSFLPSFLFSSPPSCLPSFPPSFLPFFLPFFFPSFFPSFLPPRIICVLSVILHVSYRFPSYRFPSFLCFFPTFNYFFSAF